MAKEIGQRFEIILGKIGQGKELRKFAKNVVVEEIGRENWPRI